LRAPSTVSPALATPSSGHLDTYPSNTNSVSLWDQLDISNEFKYLLEISHKGSNSSLNIKPNTNSPFSSTIKKGVNLIFNVYMQDES